MLRSIMLFNNPEQAEKLKRHTVFILRNKNEARYVRVSQILATDICPSGRLWVVRLSD